MSRFRVYLILAGIGVVALIGSLVMLSGLRVLEMGSPTMEPLVLGRSDPDRLDGDLLLITTRIKAERIRRGDLTVVEFPSWNGVGVTRSIRRICGLPGDTITNRCGSVHRLAPEYFWVEAQQTNGLDSHAFGPIHRKDISGRVICIFRVRRVVPAKGDTVADESR